MIANGLMSRTVLSSRGSQTEVGSHCAVRLDSVPGRSAFQLSFADRRIASFQHLVLCLRVVMIAFALGLGSFSAPSLIAQYSTTKFIDPNTFPTDTTPGFGLGEPIATDGTYTAISTTDAVWSKTVAGGTPQKLFSVGTDLPSSTVAAAYIYGAIAVSQGTVVFYANGAGPSGTLYGIYSVPADGSGSAVRVADSTQVGTGVWYEDVDIYGRYGLFSVADGTVVFSVGGSIYSAGTDGSNLTTLWQTNTSFTGCQTAGQDSGIFPVGGVGGAVTDGTNFAYTGGSDLSFVALYTEPLGTIDGCNDLITSGTCNICGPVSTLPGQPQPGTAFTFQDLLQIDDGYVYFQADAGGGGLNGEDYYGIFKVPLIGGAATAVVTNLSQLPLLLNGSATYDEPYFSGYAVNNGKFIVYAGDNTQGGTGQPAFYMLNGNSWITLFTNVTSVNDQCTGNMTDSTLSGLVQPELSSDGHLYFSAEYIGSGPDLNGSCNYAFLRFSPFAYYVLDTTHPLIPAQTTITLTPSPANITTSTPVTLNLTVGPAAGSGNPGALVPTGTVTVYYTSPQIYGVQEPAQTTLDSEGKATISLGEFNPAQRTFTVAYGGDSNFTSSGSNAITFDTRAKPTITFRPPADMSYGAALSATQLDATASVAGAFVYTPAAGTVLPLGVSTLSVAFTPSDTNDYQPVTATASITVHVSSTITSPTAGSTLAGPSVTFDWSSASGVTAYYLLIGSTGPGSSDIYNSAPKTVTTYTLNGMPTNGETIYVRLITNYSGLWVPADYTYTAAAEAAMTSPSTGTVLGGPSVQFTWSAAAGATGYFLQIGSTGVGSDNLYNSAEKTVTAYTFNAMPTNGEPIYVRLITNYSGTWVHADYTYTASTQAAITAPAADSVLIGPSVPFTWSAVPGATGYYLQIGSTGVGSDNLYNSAEKTVTSYTFDAMPTNGEPIYVRLNTNYNGTWVHADYTYTASTQAAMTAPAASSVLPGPSVPFTWTAATGASGYFLQIGSAGVGSDDLYNSAEKTATSYTFTGMPTNGEPIYVRLITNYNGVWVHTDYTYTATTKAAMTSPAAGSAFTGSSVPFVWTTAPGATSYYLLIGSTGVGSNNLYNSAPKEVTSYTFNGMPINGETIYVRLITNYSGVWVSSDYTYTAE